MSLYETLKRSGELTPDPEDEMKLHPTIRATKVTTQALRRIALQLGYVLKSGAMAGDGDVPAMLEAVARGDLEIVKTSEKGDITSSQKQ